MSSRKRRANDEMGDTRGSKRQSQQSKFGDGRGVAGLECYFYFKDGHCYWRDSCKYSHVETGRRAAPPVRDGFGSTAGRNAWRPDRDKVYTQWQGVDAPQVRSHSPPLTMGNQTKSDKGASESSAAANPSDFKIKGRASTEQSSPECQSASHSQSPAASHSSIKKKVTVNWPAYHSGAPHNASATPPALPPRSLDRPEYNERPVLQHVSSLRPNIQAASDVRSSVQVDYQVTTPVIPQQAPFAPENGYQPGPAVHAWHPQYSHYDRQAPGAAHVDQSTAFAHQAPLQRDVVNNTYGEAVHQYAPHNGAIAPQYASPAHEYSQQGAAGTITTTSVAYAPPHASQNLPISSAHSHSQQYFTAQGPPSGYQQQQHPACPPPLQIHHNQPQPQDPTQYQHHHEQQYQQPGYARLPTYRPSAHSTTLPPSPEATFNFTQVFSHSQPRPYSVYELPAQIPDHPPPYTSAHIHFQAMPPLDDSSLANQRSHVQASLGIPRIESPTLKPIPNLNPNALSVPTNRERYERINATSAPTSRSASTSPPKMDLNSGFPSKVLPEKEERPSDRSRLEKQNQDQPKNATSSATLTTTALPATAKPTTNLGFNPPSTTTVPISNSSSTTRSPLPFTTLPRIPLNSLPSNASSSERQMFSRQLTNELGQHIRWLEGMSTVGKRLIALDKVDGERQSTVLSAQVAEVEWAVQRLGATLRGWRQGVEKDLRCLANLKNGELEDAGAEKMEDGEKVAVKKEGNETVRAERSMKRDEYRNAHGSNEDKSKAFI